MKSLSILILLIHLLHHVAAQEEAIITPEGEEIIDLDTSETPSTDDNVDDDSTPIEGIEDSLISNDDSGGEYEDLSDTHRILDGEIDESLEESESEKELVQEASSTTEKAPAASSSNFTEPIQSGPFIDLFGPKLLSLTMVDETHAQFEEHYTNEALSGKTVVGVYVSADWCGPCRQFTPELVSFYNRMNSRKGREGKFEIVWLSRCRDMNSFGQYFTHMSWLALPPQEAMGERGQILGDLLKTKGIPHLVLFDEVGNVITYDARTKIPADKAGIGFPWRNPISIIINTFVPKSLRLLVKTHVEELKGKAMKIINKKFK